MKARAANIFTFQYVSIKTRRSCVRFRGERHLHSNMFLLRRPESRTDDFDADKFTFQYVSIKTAMRAIFNSAIIYLHSNMFLLRQRRKRTA